MNSKEIADKNEQAIKKLAKMKLTEANIKKVCKETKASTKSVGRILGLKTYRNGRYEDKYK